MPFKHNATRRHRIPRARYRVTNWAAYEAGLRRRGDITFWVDEAVLAGWQAPRRSTPGGQPRYSDFAIELALSLRPVLHLACDKPKGSPAACLRCSTGAVRRVPWCDRGVREGRWEAVRALMPSLAGKKLGVFGLGHVGMAIAQRGAGGFRMEVGYYNRRPRPDTQFRYFATLYDLASWCHVLAVSVPGGPETFRALDRLVLSPHVGGFSPEAIHTMIHAVRDNLDAHFAGRPLLTPVAG